MYKEETYVTFRKASLLFVFKGTKDLSRFTFNLPRVTQNC